MISILEDRRGALWFGTIGGGVSRYDGEGFTTFTTADGLAHNWVWPMVEDREGRLWLGTWKGLCRYDGAGRSDREGFTTFTTADGLAENRVISLLEDRDGQLWLGGDSGGITQYDGKRFHPFAPEDCPSLTKALTLLQDREGQLWLGGVGGLSRHMSRTLATFTHRDGLAEHCVLSILRDRRGVLWCGTLQGVYRYEQGRFVRFGEVGEATVKTILEDRQGRLWFGTFSGLYRYDGEETVAFGKADGLPSLAVSAALVDRRDRLWLATGVGYQTKGEWGVSRCDGETFLTLTARDGLPGTQIMAMAEDRAGRLWFGSDDGACWYDGRRMVRFTTADGLAHDAVFSLLTERSGAVWLGSWGGGVSRFDGQRFATFSTRDGLADDHVFCMMEDRRGHLWFGTTGGISRYDGTVFQSLTQRDGLAHDQVHDMLEDEDGAVWIGTQGGITCYRSQSAPPRVRLTDVVADRRYGVPEEVQLPEAHGLLAFEFQGRSFTTAQNRMAYVVRLAGCEEDWKPVYAGRVEYHRLPVGAYTFQVRAVDRDLNYSEPAEVRALVEEDPREAALAEALSAHGPAGEFVGDSPSLRQVQAQLAQVAPTELTVLILGETGTGKGLAARALHRLSGRRQRPFIQVHCGALPEALVESELFGHEKGAFTGAVARKLGKVELAEGGTLFLDEIGDMPLEAQVKLLHLLEERTFQRVGGIRTMQADVRMVAATNRDLEQMIRNGRFRRDLFFRLQVFAVQLPSLRQRLEDIPLLSAYFLERTALHLHKDIERLAPEVLERLQAYDWPGNVRELEHLIQRAVIVSADPSIQVEDLGLPGSPAAPSAGAERLTPEEYERRYLLEVLEESDWVIKGPRGAAARLGWHEATVRYRMKKLGIRRPEA